MKRKYLFYLFISLLLVSGLIQPATIYAAWNKPHYQLKEMYYSVASNGEYTFAVGKSGAMKFERGLDLGFNGSVISPFNVDLNKIISVNGEFMIVGGDGLIAKYVPLDPDTPTIYDSNTTSVLSGIAYGNGKYVAVGSSGNCNHFTRWNYLDKTRVRSCSKYLIEWYNLCK